MNTLSSYDGSYTVSMNYCQLAHMLSGTRVCGHLDLGP
jgi:hypothetical protein